MKRTKKQWTLYALYLSVAVITMATIMLTNPPAIVPLIVGLLTGLCAAWPHMDGNFVGVNLARALVPGLIYAISLGTISSPLVGLGIWLAYCALMLPTHLIRKQTYRNIFFAID